VVETEANPDPRLQPGHIDSAARTLIEQARTAGWMALTVAASGRQPSYVVYFDGAGRFCWDRVLPCGLREQVYCDGKTLWHLYPEIALGAKRPFSRFHQSVIGDLVPWLVPAADDLARGADVLLVDKGVVAVQARDADKLRDADDQPVPFVQLQMVFGGDGRLIERRLVRLPGQHLLWRQCYDADGTVREVDAASDKVTAQARFALAKASAPALTPKTGGLVVVPMPFRTPEHLMRNLPNKASAWPQYFSELKEEAAIAMLAGMCAESPRFVEQAKILFAVRFHGRGDKRLGFYVLLASAGIVLNPGEAYHATGEGKQYFFDVVREHPKEPLAMYLAYHFDAQRLGTKTALGNLGGSPHGFVQRLSAFRDLYLSWKIGLALKGDSAKQTKEWQRMLQSLGKAPSPVFDWALLMTVCQQSGTGTPERHKALTEAVKTFVGDNDLGYALRYEVARGWWRAGDIKAAHKEFCELYLKRLEEGSVPPVDADFKACLDAPAGGQSYAEVMRTAAGVLAKRGQPFHILALAEQARLLGDGTVVEDLTARALTACESGRDRNLVRLSIVYHLVQTGQTVRADTLLQLVLAEEPFKQSKTLWRLAANLAEQRNMTARALACLDRALELEFRDLPPVIHLKTVRSDYTRLLQQFQTVANALALLEREPSQEFVAKVVRAADRWRSLDPDASDVCRLTARILQTVGAHDLAWDYLTTPIGLRPNEAAPWLQLAQSLRGEGLFDMADRAYAAAFEAEATNAQILWDRAENLVQAGRAEDALAVYRVLATGTWQERFVHLQAQAKQRLNQQ
jgi:tetratricopeptide (TPR) repeat protein